MRTIFIGDVHGCHLTLDKLVNETLNIQLDDHLIMLGDYVDRGPRSKQVIDFLIDLKEKGQNLTLLKGNHESMFQDTWNMEPRDEDYDIWKSCNGGRETLESFGVGHSRFIDARYLDFLKSLALFTEIVNPPTIAAHAGLDFSAPDPLTPTRHMLWIRPWDMNVNKAWLGKRILVHGHTPTRRSEIEAELANLEEDQILCIDNGCFQKGRDGYGNLCAFDATNRKLYFEPCIDNCVGY